MYRDCSDDRKEVYADDERRKATEFEDRARLAAKDGCEGEAVTYALLAIRRELTAIAIEFDREPYRRWSR